MKSLIGVRDEGDEDRQNHVDEEADKDVQVDLPEDIGWGGHFRHAFISCVHVISVDQGEKTFRCHKWVTKLKKMEAG